MTFFNDAGRRIPTKGMRVFGEEPSFYYQLEKLELKYASIFSRLETAGLTNGMSKEVFQERADRLLKVIGSDPHYAKILDGAHIPFVAHIDDDATDIGNHLEKELLGRLKDAFISLYPNFHFKAVVQGNASLAGRIGVADHSKQEHFLSKARAAPVVGWYFPQALQEFDIASQRKQMLDLPEISNAGFCLSGGLDAVAAVIGSPQILQNPNTYPPVLCLSGYQHEDPRLVLLLKAYGPHLEFWCMTQMLTSTVTQVSEQWAGGLSIFA